MEGDPAREYPEWIVPHADYGDPTCPGLILPQINGETALLLYNDCGFVLRSVPATDVLIAITELSSSDLCTYICPHCESVNAFSGLSAMLAYTCRNCGTRIKVESSSRASYEVDDDELDDDELERLNEGVVIRTLPDAPRCRGIEFALG